MIDEYLAFTPEREIKLEPSTKTQLQPPIKLEPIVRTRSQTQLQLESLGSENFIEQETEKDTSESDPTSDPDT